jgi:hypothetical protein
VRGLSLSDWLSLLEAWWALAVFYAGLRWMSYARLEQFGRSRLIETSEQLPTARRLHRLVGWASRLHLFPMTCLVQSLALRWMLSRRGIDSQLKIGATKISGALHAHAWLEIGGEKIGVSEDLDGVFRALTGGTLP